MTTQEIRDRTARQFREARKTPEGRALARIVWRALKQTRKEIADKIYRSVTKTALSRNT